MRGKQHCKAAGKKCEKCGKIGHFGKVCRSNPATADDKTVKADEVKETNQQANAAWGYQDGNWACRVDIRPGTVAGQNLNPQ